uniref:Uncharacterized protein n=1 Tax=Oryza rufipogon TaxID=4529 RepID=A0A0E0NSG4_ORYRU
MGQDRSRRLQVAASHADSRLPLACRVPIPVVGHPVVVRKEKQPTAVLPAQEGEGEEPGAVAGAAKLRLPCLLTTSLSLSGVGRLTYIVAFDSLPLRRWPLRHHLSAANGEPWSVDRDYGVERLWREGEEEGKIWMEEKNI